MESTPICNASGVLMPYFALNLADISARSCEISTVESPSENSNISRYLLAKVLSPALEG